MHFVAMFECCSIFNDAFSWSLADYRRPVPYLFCLPFPNRASDSGDLYIDFDRNQLTFLVELLDFQVEAKFNHSFPSHALCTAYRIPHIMPCSCVGCLLCCVLLSGVASWDWFR